MSDTENGSRVRATETGGDNLSRCSQCSGRRLAGEAQHGLLSRLHVLDRYSRRGIRCDDEAPRPHPLLVGVVRSSLIGEHGNKSFSRNTDRHQRLSLFCVVLCYSRWWGISFPGWVLIPRRRSTPFTKNSMNTWVANAAHAYPSRWKPTSLCGSPPFTSSMCLTNCHG